MFDDDGSAPIPNRYDSVPPDPGLVHIDLALSELSELPMDDIEDLEALDDEVEVGDEDHLDRLEAIEELEPVDARPVVVPPPPTRPPGQPAQPVPAAAPQAAAPVARAPATRPDVDTAPPPANRARLYRHMLTAFFVSMGATMALVVLPWWLWVSPAFEATRVAARERAAVPVVVPVVQVAPVPTVAAVEPVPEPTPEPVVEPEPIAEPEPEPVAEPEPAVAARPRPAPAPRPAPSVRPAPRPAPEPEPAPTPAPVKPAPVKTAPAPAPAVTPPEALALNGKYQGKAGSDALFMQVILGANGRAIAHLRRGDGEFMTARGSYTLTAGRASVAISEPGDEAASYTLLVEDSGITGRVITADGKNKPVKARR